MISPLFCERLNDWRQQPLDGGFFVPESFEHGTFGCLPDELLGHAEAEIAFGDDGPLNGAKLRVPRQTFNFRGRELPLNFLQMDQNTGDPAVVGVGRDGVAEDLCVAGRE